MHELAARVEAQDQEMFLPCGTHRSRHEPRRRARRIHDGTRIGTPAAPEPYASRIQFFTRKELGEVARRAGFAEIQVEEPDLENYARAAHVPEEAIPMFQRSGGSLLLTARRP